MGKTLDELFAAHDNVTADYVAGRHERAVYVTAIVGIHSQIAALTGKRCVCPACQETRAHASNALEQERVAARRHANRQLILAREGFDALVAGRPHVTQDRLERLLENLTTELRALND